MLLNVITYYFDILIVGITRILPASHVPKYKPIVTSISALVSKTTTRININVAVMCKENIDDLENSENNYLETKNILAAY